MAPRLGKLSAIAVNKLGQGYHYDGGGLILQVTASNARSWIFRFDFQGRRREMGLGPTHTISLAEAREAARQARQKVLEGIDPIEARNTTRRQAEQEKANALTFADCSGKYIATHRSGWKNPKHTAQWKSTLETYCAGFNGKPVSNVSRADVLACLEAIWTEKHETATRLRGRIESILDWATVHGLRAGDNPARWKGNLDHLLPTISKIRRIKHHRALPWQEIAPFMANLRQEVGLAPRALEFLILTACRSGEVRAATWDEIDMENRLWVIPAERMKMGKEHRVPLSQAAIELLISLPRLQEEPLVFPSTRAKKILSDMSLTAVMRRMEVDAVPHGFRSTFRDWAGESTSYPREVCEHALAHRLADGVEAAYQRGDMLKKRASMMKDWAAFCFAEEQTITSDRQSHQTPEK